MKPEEAMKILDPADPYDPKSVYDVIHARALASAALTKMIGKEPKQGRCQICGTRLHDPAEYCYWCGQKVKWR